MRFKRIFPASVALAAMFVVVSCSTTTSPVDAVRGNVLRIRSGTYYGECTGYCYSELTIDSISATLVRTSTDPLKFPSIHSRLELDANEWRGLVAAADIRNFPSSDSTLGCPDCRDQGGEWVELESSSGRRRMTFDYGLYIPQVHELLARVRTIRERLRN